MVNTPPPPAIEHEEYNNIVDLYDSARDADAPGHPPNGPSTALVPAPSLRDGTMNGQGPPRTSHHLDNGDMLPAPGRPLMQLANRSTPALPHPRDIGVDHPPLPNTRHHGPPPSFDPNDLGFNNMHISDPIQRTGTSMSYRSADARADPIPRSGTSMSHHHRMPPPRGASAYPPHPQWRGPPQGHPGPQAPPAPGQVFDSASIYSGGSGGGYSEYDQFDDRASIRSGDRGTYGTMLPYHYPPRHGPPPPGPYNRRPPPDDGMYAAASFAGLDLPPGAAPPPSVYNQGAHYPPPGPPGPPVPAGPGSSEGYLSPSQSSVYAGSSGASMYQGSSGASMYQGSSGASIYQGSSGASMYQGSSGASMYQGSSGASIYQGSSGASIRTDDTNDDFQMRPSLQRAGTTLSVAPNTKKTKAIDVSQMPYTKEFVDQYRARMKEDPDPESHFNYAKYLIEAAKHIGEGAEDQRSVRKYRDTLIAESLKVIRKLATTGETFAEAQFFLANCCGTGMLGLQVDHEKAYHLYMQAAKQDHAAACYRVAVCNEIGAGTKKEPRHAVAFYRKAASLGDTAAMYKLGMIHLQGQLGQPKNPREGVPWLRRAAEQADAENPHALHELGLLHEQPGSQIVVHDEAYAKDLFTRAAQLGYVRSQFKLGTAYEYGQLTCPVDPKRSIAWYTKAAQKGDAEAELALSGWYLTGSEGVLKQSDSEAYLWARRAANKGLSKAEYAVGYYAEVGIGLKVDIEFAKRWYMRAAAQGNKRAMARLTDLKRAGNRRVGAGARPTRAQANKEDCVIA